MRFSVVVLFVASVASAYTVLKRQDAVPACATTCFQNSDPAPCAATDNACLCANPNFWSAVATCAQSSCSAEELQAAGPAAVAFCKAAGVDLQNPLPPCATPCLTKTSPAACPTKDDEACMCKDATYIKALDTCFRSSCAGQDLTNAETVGEAICRAAGVDISSIIGAA